MIGPSAKEFNDASKLEEEFKEKLNSCSIKYSPGRQTGPSSLIVPEKDIQLSTKHDPKADGKQIRQEMLSKSNVELT